MYTLTCTVTVVEYLVAQPTVEWLDSDNTAIMSRSGITVDSVMPSGSTLTLEFNPLRTAHGGKYTCRATHDSLGIIIADPSGNMDMDVVVQSKKCHIWCSIIFTVMVYFVLQFLHLW